MKKMYIVLSFLLTVLAVYLKDWLNDSVMVGIVLQVFIYGIPSAIICYKCYHRFTIKDCALVILFFAVLFIVLKINFSNEYLMANYLFTLRVLVIVPLCEELFFRGFVYHFIAYEFDKDPKYPILLSAAIFSIFHINPVSMIVSFVFGVIFAFILYKSKSLSFLT